MMEEGKYIYSIIKENRDQRFSLPGINNREVNLLHLKDIAAVVSPTPIINFDRLDKEKLTRHVACHQRVNEELMREYDVCPMTFGMIAPSVSEVLRILERAYLQFKTALKRIEGKAEFVVQVWWDQKKLLEELANTNPEIQKLKQAYSRLRPVQPVGLSAKLGRDGLYRAGLSSHRPSESKIQNRETSLKRNILGMPIKLKLGKLIQKEAEMRRQTFIQDIYAFLRNSSHDSTSNKLVDDACPVGSRRLSFGEMIANFSFLIERTKESELDRKMQELGKKYEGKLRFKYIGPMPSYSFVNINLSLGNFEVVNEARKLLGLAEEVTLDEIKKTYYILAHKYHPDKYGRESETAEEMKKITEAYSILENYCSSCDELMGKVEGKKYSFKEEDVKNSIIIK